MLMIDGSYGEGGGQILRTSLALSILTETPFQISKIRARRKKPGLLRQHLTAVRAAAEISGADVDGDKLGARELLFRPGTAKAGDYRFSIGTAGSVGLVLQTVLFPLLFADGPSTVVLEGGTHNPMSPPYDFLVQTFFPILGRLGADVSLELERAGFYPAGGGRYRVTITPADRLLSLSLLERGDKRGPARARAVVANLPTHIAERELKVITERLGIEKAHTSVEEIESDGPGNVVFVELPYDNVTEVVSGFGEKGLRAERVAKTAASEAEGYLATTAPVGEHLADQLLIPLALGAGGSFRAQMLSEHTQTNIEVIQKFVDVTIRTEAQEDGTQRVDVTPA